MNKYAAASMAMIVQRYREALTKLESDSYVTMDKRWNVHPRSTTDGNKAVVSTLQRLAVVVEALDDKWAGARTMRTH